MDGACGTRGLVALMPRIPLHFIRATLLVFPANAPNRESIAKVAEGRGRSHEEIAETKRLTGALVDFARRMEYENHEDFANFIGKAIHKKLQNPG